MASVPFRRMGFSETDMVANFFSKKSVSPQCKGVCAKIGGSATTDKRATGALAEEGDLCAFW